VARLPDKAAPAAGTGAVAGPAGGGRSRAHRDRAGPAATASDGGIAALAPAERANIVHVAGPELVFPQPLARSIVYNAATFARRRAAHRVLAETLDPGLRRLLHEASTVDRTDDALAAELRRAATEPGTTRLAASRARQRAAELTTEPTLAATDLVTAARLAWEGGRPHLARMLLRKLGPVRATPVATLVDLLQTEIDLRCGPPPCCDAARSSPPADRDPDRATAVRRVGLALLLSGACAHYVHLARHSGDAALIDQLRGLDRLFRGDHARAAAPLRRSVSRAGNLDDPAALSQAALSAVLVGDNPGAYRLAARAAVLARFGGDAAMVPPALELVAMAAATSGHYDVAVTALRHALPLARATGQQNLATHLLAGWRWWPPCSATVTSAGGGSARRARSRSVPGCSGPGRWSSGPQAALDLATGHPAEAMTRLRNLLTRRSGHPQLAVYLAAAPQLVEAAVRAGERRPALVALRRFEPWATGTGDPAWLALVARCRALVAEDIAETEHHYTEALALHARAEATFDQARTQLLYGQELRRTRRPAAAREQLRAALGRCGGSAPRRGPSWPRPSCARPASRWASSSARVVAARWAARGRLAGPQSAGQPVGQPEVDAAATLTPQQLKIARLAAAGATNREVAAQLFLSPRTVDHHMRNIFLRLGIRSRFDLARLLI
jgi:DNA-binding CsgD family transcriptional regulator